MNEELSIIAMIRPANSDDYNFIKSTFARGVYYGDDTANLIPKDVFFSNFSAFLDTLVLNSNILVACLKEDPSVILGYAATNKEQTALHWVYVKAAWRKKGIAKALIPPTITQVTHLTNLGKILLNKIPNCIFNPFNI